MATGTGGNDNLSNDPNVEFETIDALSGDDVITILRLNSVSAFPGAITTVSGGAGFDTLRFGTDSTEQRLYGLTATDFDGTLGVRHNSISRWDINWTSIERLEITGVPFFTSASFS